VINNKKILGVVLARAGSKGLPGKNFKLLAGKPLVQYAIEAGTNSVYIDDVIMSTDCETCIEITSGLGIKVPFRRPAHLSGDSVPSADVIEHAIKYLQHQGDNYDIFVLLEPTSPLRDAFDVDAALEALVLGQNKSLVSVCQAEDQHPSFIFKIIDNKKLFPWESGKFVPLRRQDLQPAYYLDGSIYISYIDTYLRLKTFCHEDTEPYIVPKWKAYEVDDFYDYICIEAIMKYRTEKYEASNA
jgi:CMP-N,N'-diacetyllegionaminic acid synthase